jgi:hypothetical protein
VETFVPGNDVTFPPGFLDGIRRSPQNKDAFLVEPTLKGTGVGHGTKMASLAAGKSVGMAPNADLFLAKYKGRWNTGRLQPQPDGTSTPLSDRDYAAQPEAVAAVLDRIRTHIEARLQAESTKDRVLSVINFSWGKYHYCSQDTCF